MSYEEILRNHSNEFGRTVAKAYHMMYGAKSDKQKAIDSIKNVIFNDPVTVVIWSDGSKTVVRCQEGDTYDPEKGLAMAIVKRTFGNNGWYCDIFKKWLPEEELSEEIQKDSYSVKEAAEKLSVSEDTIRARIKSGKLSGRKEKGKWIVTGII